MMWLSIFIVFVIVVVIAEVISIRRQRRINERDKAELRDRARRQNGQEL